MRIVPLPMLGLLATFSLAACAVTPPAGPTVLAAPGNGKNFEQFRNDDYSCRQYARTADGARPTAANTGVRSAATGTLLGAAAGALLGAATGSAGAGAAFGAGGGLLLGSAAGGNDAQASNASLQAAYDRVYVQCMVASGQDVSLPVAYPQPVIVESGWGW